MNYRPQRVSNLIQEELGKLLLREVEFEEGVLVTITGVDVNDNLEHARVRVSVFPSEKFKKALMVLQKMTASLQYKLLKKLNIKPMPKISFEVDHGLENAARVEKALLEGDNGR